MDIAKTRAKSKQIIDRSILKSNKNSNLPQKMYHHINFDKDLDEYDFLLKALKLKKHTLHIDKQLDKHNDRLRSMIFLVKIGLFRTFRKHHQLYFKLTDLGLDYGIQLNAKDKKESLSSALVSLVPLIMAFGIVNTGGLIINPNLYNLFCLLLTDLLIFSISILGLFLRYKSCKALSVNETNYLPYLKKHTNHHQYLIIKGIIRNKDSYYSSIK